MARRNRLLRKALKSLNYVYDNSKHEVPMNDINDVKLLLSEAKNDIEVHKGLIQDCEDNIKICEDNVVKLQNIINQIEIEEYKELNPGKNIFKL